MNPVILISSCARDQQAGNNQVVRETWGAKSQIPVFFILGQGCTSTHPTEIVLPVKDDYFSLPCKTQEGHRWAREQGYDYMFQCFTDTFIDPTRLLASDFTRADYIGNKGAWPANARERAGLEFCHGGPGYWLSPKATDLMLAADIGRENLEDQFVAAVMKANEIFITDDKRYSMGTTYGFREQPVLPQNDAISCHLSMANQPYHKNQMIKAHNQRFL